MSRRALAILVIIVGVLALTSPSISCKTRETVVDAGPTHVTSDKTTPIPVPRSRAASPWHSV